MEVTLRWDISGGEGPLRLNIINAVERESSWTPDPLAFSFAERQGRADVTCRKSPISSFMAPHDHRISKSYTLQDGANKYGAWAL